MENNSFKYTFLYISKYKLAFNNPSMYKNFVLFKYGVNNFGNFSVSIYTYFPLYSNLFGTSYLLLL